MSLDFIYNSKEIKIEANDNEYMKDIFEKLSKSIKENYNSLSFYYNGENINPNIKLEELRNNDSEIKIYTFKHYEFIKSKYIKCSLCNNNCELNMDNFKICLEKCDEGHDSLYIPLQNIDQFNSTQLINQSNIICWYCKTNKSNSPDNKFFKCFSCNKDICPSCKNNAHDKENKDHNIIDYDDMNFLCKVHKNEKYISYCENCKKNLCLYCQKKHKNESPPKIIDFSDIIPEKNLNLEEFENNFNEFKIEINNLKNILFIVENNINIYFNIFKDLINNYNENSRNYQVLKTSQNIYKYNDILIKEMENIKKEKEIKDKFNEIIKLYNMMTEKDNNNSHNYTCNNINSYKDSMSSYIFSNSDNSLLHSNRKNVTVNNKEKTNNILLEQFNLDENNCQKFKTEELRKANENEITIKYINKKEEKEIILLGEKFVNNNKDNCKFIINGKTLDLKKKYKKDKNLTKEIIEGKLKILSPLTDISYMFNECSSIIYISGLHNIDTSRINNMAYLFCECCSLKSLDDISKWKTNNVKNMKYLFGGCRSLLKLPDISNWNTSNVTDMSFMFCDCQLLEELPNISKWDISNVVTLNAMFSGCSKLSKLPNLQIWNANKVNDASYMFRNCNCLLESNLPQFHEGIKKDYYH